MSNQPIDELMKSKTDEVLRERERILHSGLRPEVIYVARVGEGLLTRPHPNEGMTLRMFTSQFQALDYLRCNRIEATVGVVKFEDLPRGAKSWKVGGMSGYAWNPCPRCNIEVVAPVDTLLSPEETYQSWAVARSVRNWKGSRLLLDAMNHFKASALGQARSSLEEIRDHVACDSPYLFQLLATIAIVQGDAESLSLATDRVKEFGPPFAEEPGFSPRLFATASVSLMADFGKFPASKSAE